MLRLFATMVEAGRDIDDGKVADRFYVVQTYLSSVTVLYKRNGFSPAEVDALNKHTVAMAFDDIYYPGLAFDPAIAKPVMQGYRDQYFFNPQAVAAAGLGTSNASDPTIPQQNDPTVPRQKDPTIPSGTPADASAPGAGDGGALVPATTLARFAMHSLINGSYDQFAKDYVFRTEALTNDRPYFSFLKPLQDMLAVDAAQLEDSLEDILKGYPKFARSFLAEKLKEIRGQFPKLLRDYDHEKLSSFLKSPDGSPVSSVEEFGIQFMFRKRGRIVKISFDEANLSGPPAEFIDLLRRGRTDRDVRNDRIGHDLKRWGR